MPTVLPNYVYLNEQLIDETWMYYEPGLTESVIRDIGAKVEAKAKVGMPKFLQWLVTDSQIEAKAGGDYKTSKKVTHPSFLRSLLLTEMIEDVLTGKGSNAQAIAQQPIGTFIDVECHTPLFLNIPAFADFVFGSQLIDYANSVVDDKPDIFISAVEKMTNSKSAFTLSAMLKSDDDLRPTYEAMLGELTNAMILSKDDLTLAWANLAGRQTRLTRSLCETRE